MIRVLESCMRSTGAVVSSASYSEGKEGHSRFAPLSKDSPRKDGGEGSKRAKVGEGGDRENRGSFAGQTAEGGGHLLSEHWAGGGTLGPLGEGRGSGGDRGQGGGGDHGFSPTNGGDAELLGGESEYEEERRHKKKKKKKHKDHEKHGSAPGSNPEPTLPARTLQASQSEPSVGGKVNAPPPLTEDRGGSFAGPQPREVPGSLFPDRSGFAAATTDAGAQESLSTVGRARIKAGIRLQPIGAGPLGPAPSNLSTPQEPASGMQSSVSVPELKPLDKLHPLM